MNKTAQEQVINKINTALELFENPWNDLGGKKVLTDLKKDVEEIFTSQFQSSPKWVRWTDGIPNKQEQTWRRIDDKNPLDGNLIYDFMPSGIMYGDKIIPYNNLEWLDETGSVSPQAGEPGLPTDEQILNWYAGNIDFDSPPLSAIKEFVLWLKSSAPISPVPVNKYSQLDIINKGIEFAKRLNAENESYGAGACYGYASGFEDAMKEFALSPVVKEEVPVNIFFIDEVRKLLNQYLKEEISFSKFVEALNDKATNSTAIDRYMASLPASGKVEDEDWVSVEDSPLFTKDANGHWECTEAGDGEFWAAVPYNDHKQPDKRDLVWIRHCVVEDGIGLCVVGGTDNEPAGYQLEDVAYYIPIKLPALPQQ